MKLKTYIVSLVNMSSDPGLNLEGDIRVFQSLYDAEETLKEWRNAELEYQKSEEVETTLVEDTESKCYITWAGGNEGILITISERELDLPEHIILQKVHGWTHGDPAMVWNMTDYDLYFMYEPGGSLELVEDTIDKFEDRRGSFYMRADEYEKAFQEIEEHDRQFEE